jgi:hypothetical protein
MKRVVLVIFLVAALSIGFVAYSASLQSALASPIVSNSDVPTIIERRWCVWFPLLCSEPQFPTPQIPQIQPPGPVCLSCPNLDISNLGLNETVILTPFDGSVAVTKVPTATIFGQDIIAQLNRTNITGNP